MLFQDNVHYIIEKSNHVFINCKSLKKFAFNLKLKDIKYKPLISLNKFHTLDEYINFLFLFTSINFCYWQNPNWGINYKGNEYRRSIGLAWALRKAYDDDPSNLDYKYLKHIDIDGFKRTLNLDRGISLLKERYEIVKNISRIIVCKYSENFKNVLIKADYKCEKIVSMLIKDFPSFDDSSIYKGKKIGFYKRAQLLISMLHYTQGIEIRGIENLSAFADYRVPQILRHIGILKYSNELAMEIDSEKEIIKDSEKEIEIRAATVWAIEKMRLLIKNYYQKDLNAAQVDNYLWNECKRFKDEMKPHHKTLTIYY